MKFFLVTARTFFPTEYPVNAVDAEIFHGQGIPESFAEANYFGDSSMTSWEWIRGNAPLPQVACPEFRFVVDPTIKAALSKLPGTKFRQVNLNCVYEVGRKVRKELSFEVEYRSSLLKLERFGNCENRVFFEIISPKHGEIPVEADDKICRLSSTGSRYDISEFRLSPTSLAKYTILGRTKIICGQDAFDILSPALHSNFFHTVQFDFQQFS